MPTTYYQTMNGRIRNQETGGTRIDYLTDALGSITATVDGTGNVARSYRYKPYGASLATTGSGTVPGFRWTGDTGSKPGGRPYSEQYNRVRHYSLSTANWSTVDPLWPSEPGYQYGLVNPVNNIDPSGLSCKPKILISVDEMQCEANCSSIFGIGCYCTFTFSFILNITLMGQGCKKCNMYQWVADRPIGDMVPDTRLGWPYPWGTTGPPAWSTHDEPTYSGAALGCPDLKDWRSFITCLDCDGQCECWSWEIQASAPGCDKSKCWHSGPDKKSPGAALTKEMCRRGRIGTSPPNSPGGSGPPIRYP